MKCFLIILSSLIAAFGVQAQDGSRVRTRTIDYTKYDQLGISLAYAPDKTTATKNLLAFSDANFTAVDEEYYNVRVLVATYATQVYDNQRAMEFLQQAIEAFEKNYPFYNRGYASVTKDNILQTYLSLVRAEIALNLFDKAIQYLESKRSLLEPSLSFSVTQQFYSLYANALLGAQRYDEAILVALKIRDLTEAGKFVFPSQNPDEIYKIDPSYPKETRDMMLKAKEQYIISMRESQASVLASQRLDYNRILSEAYYRQYQYAEGVPYMKAMADEMSKLLEYSKNAMLKSQEQFKNVNLADSLRQQMNNATLYIDKIRELGTSSAFLIISACKSGQPQLASMYALGKVEKALLFQMTGKQTDAEREYQASFALMKSMGTMKLFAGAGDQYYKAYLPFYINLQVQKGDFKKAYDEMSNSLRQEEESLKKNFRFFTESEKKEFFKAYNEKLTRYYSLLLLMTEKNDDRANELLEKILQTKGMILDATLAQEKQLKKITDQSVRAQVRTIRKLRDKLAAFYQLSLKNPNQVMSDSINAISIRINVLERKVNEKLGTIPDILKPVSWKSVQSKLKTGQVYVEILKLKRDDFLFDKPVTQYWGFALKKEDTKPTLFKLSEGEAFENRDLKNYQNRIHGELEDNDSYRTYWAAIQDHCKGADKIVLSEDGIYHVINPLTIKNPATGKYLANEIFLTRVSTGRDFVLAAESPSLNVTMALVANPAFAMSRKGNVNRYQGNEFDRVEDDSPVTREGLVDLPGTQKEVESIESAANDKGVKSDVFSGTQATEANIKALKNPKVLHLATHGAFEKSSNADSYLRARLILAGAADKEPFTLSDYQTYEDGVLTAYEVTQLDLAQTDLVVLSACETGLGEVQSGEGVWGLQRAFQLAGAKTVMGSLWRISDEATVIFMTAFYKKYLTTADVEASYVDGMRATMEEYPNPYYWGAFVLTGAQ